MTVTAVSATGLFDPDTRDKASVARVIALATYGGGTKSQRKTARSMLAESMGRRGADFRVKATTSTVDSLTQVLDLTDEGVTFPASTHRKVRIVCRSQQPSGVTGDAWVQEIEQDVWGNDGTTPVLGDAKLVDAFICDAGSYKKLGRVHLQCDETGVETALTNTGTSQATVVAGTGNLTVPPCRAIKVIGAHYSPDTQAAAEGCVAIVEALEGNSGGAAGANFQVSLVDASAGAADTPDTGQLDIELELWPAVQTELVLNSAAVEVHLGGGVASSTLTHELEVFVGATGGNLASEA